MPCPYFLPDPPFVGPAWCGHCAAAPGAAIDRERMRSLCNEGYARALCPSAEAAEPDAYRFLIHSASEGAVSVAWSAERNHFPLAVGRIDVTLAGDYPAEALDRQARAFAESYAHSTKL